MTNEVSKAEITIRAIRFFEKYVVGPDGEMQAEDWVEYCAPGAASFTTIEDAVRRLQRDRAGKFQSIAGAYKAWKEGSEIPVEGTPLGAWPGCTQAQAEVLKANNIRTVEDVANLTETLLTRLRIPNPRALKAQAARYLEARSHVGVEEAIRKRDDEIAALRAQMEDMIALMGGQPDEGAVGEAPRRGRPRKSPDQVAA